MQPATRASRQPLGGSSRGWRHRVVRFHVPLALGSALVLVALMTLPPFDANAYPHADVRSGAVPQQRARGAGAPMGHGRDQPGPTRHGSDQTGPTGHSDDQAGPMEHGGEQPGPTGHGRDQPASSGEPPGDFFLGLSSRRFTVATGYLATGLLAFTLLIGPANLLLRRRNPVSSYLRRDAGMWTVIFSVVHVIYGLQVHGQLRNALDYFVVDGRPLTNSFGLGNWTGLAATVIVVGLLALSSDSALRKLKAGPWKRLQRLNYALFALVIAHAFFYGALLRTNSPYTLLLLLSVIAVFVGQAVGVWLWRRRHARTSVRQRARQPGGPPG
jgi:methionine sulfoxide reductase heme-binding subunit